MARRTRTRGGRSRRRRQRGGCGRCTRRRTGGRRTKRRGGRRRTRRRVPWAGWGKLAPFGHARTVMKRRCGKKCFLGPGKSFPVCAKGTCKVNKKGVYAAYIRAREWGKPRRSYKGKARPRHRRSVYQRVARRARKMLGKGGRRRRYRGGGTTHATTGASASAKGAKGKMSPALLTTGSGKTGHAHAHAHAHVASKHHHHHHQH